MLGEKLRQVLEVDGRLNAADTAGMRRVRRWARLMWWVWVEGSHDFVLRASLIALALVMLACLATTVIGTLLTIKSVGSRAHRQESVRNGPTPADERSVAECDSGR